MWSWLCPEKDHVHTRAGTPPVVFCVKLIHFVQPTTHLASPLRDRLMSLFFLFLTNNRKTTKDHRSVTHALKFKSNADVFLILLLHLNVSVNSNPTSWTYWRLPFIIGLLALISISDLYDSDSYRSPSILMSKGPSLLSENPLSARSICMEEQPASSRTPSMLPGLMFTSDSRASSSLKRPSKGFTRPLEKQSTPVSRNTVNNKLRRNT